MNSTYPPRFMEQVDSIIKKNISNKSFSVDQLSKLLLLSNCQVYRKIKEHTDLCPSAYINQTRLACAKNWIENTDLRLSEIIYEVGFNCLSHFSRSFSKKYGYPPSQLRKNNNK